MRDSLHNLCTCWRVSRTDGVVQGFTDADQDLVIDSILYSARGGITRSAIDSNNTVSVDNLEVEGMLDHESISKADLISGKYDNAEVEIFTIDYTNPSGVKQKLRAGWVGEVIIVGSKFVAEIRGLTQAFSQTIGELYSPLCRATFGDFRCKVQLDPIRTSILGLRGSDTLVCSGINQPEYYWKYGKVRFTSGKSVGVEREIVGSRSDTITIVCGYDETFAIGDDLLIWRGCDKTFSMCCKEFNNAINFRGEPFIPSRKTFFDKDA